MAAAGELEQAVMEILWSRPNQLSVRDVHELLNQDRDLAYTTVMTVLDRLTKKGLTTRDLEGRAWLYRPAHSRTEELAARMIEALTRLEPAERSAVLAAVATAFNGVAANIPENGIA